VTTDIIPITRVVGNNYSVDKVAETRHTMPFGPKVLRMRSPIAIAPTNDD